MNLGVLVYDRNSRYIDGTSHILETGRGAKKKKKKAHDYPRTLYGKRRPQNRPVCLSGL